MGERKKNRQRERERERQEEEERVEGSRKEGYGYLSVQFESQNSLTTIYVL